MSLYFRDLRRRLNLWSRRPALCPLHHPQPPAPNFRQSVAAPAAIGRRPTPSAKRFLVGVLRLVRPTGWPDWHRRSTAPARPCPSARATVPRQHFAESGDLSSLDPKSICGREIPDVSWILVSWPAIPFPTSRDRSAQCPPRLSKWSCRVSGGRSSPASRRRDRRVHPSSASSGP